MGFTRKLEIEPKFDEVKNLNEEPIYFETPLSKLLAKEAGESMRNKMRTLRILLLSYLTLDQNIFLQDKLGSKWDEKFHIPLLERIGDLDEYLEKESPVIKERLNILMKIQAGKSNSEIRYLSSLPYFLTTEKEAIEVYEGVLKNGHLFPRGFFKHDEGRKAGIVTRYMYENLLGFNQKEIFGRATKRNFRDNKLGTMLATSFNNSLQSALDNAYPRKEYPLLYGEEDDSKDMTGGLSHIVDSLDKLFGENEK